jgi:hypothetical protein
MKSFVTFLIWKESVIYVSHYSDPNRICLFAKRFLQNLDVIVDEVFRLPWRPVLPGTATALVSLLQALLTDLSISWISTSGCRLNLSSFFISREPAP